MASGAPFDLGIVTSGAIAGLIKQGKVAAGTQKPVARFGVGMMVATGARKPGPLPASLQSYIAFDSGVSASAKNPAGAKALAEFLTQPEATAVLKAKGHEPG
jgi:molybdate transport system substrate-binding protein